MSQSYLCLFDALNVTPSEVVPAAEMALATSGFTFDGTVRKFERGVDRLLYYGIETERVDTWTDGMAKALAERWPGVAFECRFRGYDVTVGVYGDGGRTALTMDHDSVLFYELQNDEETRQEWFAGLISLLGELSPTICVFRKGGLKEAVESRSSPVSRSCGRNGN